MNFDFNQHFKNYSTHLFFNESTYGDLLLDVSAFSNTLDHLDTVGLKIKSPYLTMVGLLSCLIRNKTAVLISPLETEASTERLHSQIKFEAIIEDHHFKNLKSQTDFTFCSIDQDRASVVVFSSGTTNAPKGVALSFNNIYYSALGFIEYFKQRDNEVSLMNLPHNHVGGLMTLWRTFFSGGSLISESKKNADFISLVPLQLKRWMDNIEQLSLLKKCRVILIGGAPLTETLKTEAVKSGLNIFETYGMSETTSLMTINGEVLPYRKLALDTEGFFLVDGPVKSLGYFQNQKFYPHREGPFKTNDKGELTVSGTFKFKERSDLIFISGGENINPLIVEDAAKICPDINDAYLLPIQDEKWGEMGVMLYETKGKTISPETLENHLKKFLHPYLVPKYFFETKINFEGSLKPKRSELKNIAKELYLKTIFSFDFIENKNAPLMVFFHGFLGDKEDFKIIARKLGSKFSYLFIDLPGHGQTKIENFHSLSDIMTKLSDLIKFFDAEPYFYGYSMGGRIALNLSLNYINPKFLILESAGLGLSNSEEKIDRRKSDLNLFSDTNDAQSFIKNWYCNPMFAPYKNSESFNQDCEKKSKHSLTEWRDSQIYLSQGCFPTMGENLEKFTKTTFPHLYIYGEDDSKYAANKSYFKNTIEIKGAGHNPNKTHPSEIAELLTKTLK